MNKHLETWIEGWKTGDAEFATYIRTLTASTEGATLQTISDAVVDDRDGDCTAWGWWKDGSHEGAGLVKARPEGICLERVTYYTPRRPV